MVNSTFSLASAICKLITIMFSEWIYSRKHSVWQVLRIVLRNLEMRRKWLQSCIREGVLMDTSGNVSGVHLHPSFRPPVFSSSFSVSFFCGKENAVRTRKNHSPSSFGWNPFSPEFFLSCPGNNPWPRNHVPLYQTMHQKRSKQHSSAFRTVDRTFSLSRQEMMDRLLIILLHLLL